MTPLEFKSTVQQICDRFDQDLERFSHLETGQSATVDAPLAMQLMTAAAVASTRSIKRVLDIGCGAGNNTLKLREVLCTEFDADLLDLSRPMLTRAAERWSEVSRREPRLIEGDFRTVSLRDNAYDVILAGAVFHHLRDDADWVTAFKKLYRITAPGGSVWITDLVSHEIQGVQQQMWQRYGAYLQTLGGENYRDKVFAYIDVEDSPRPVTYQLELLRQVGFSKIDLLHKNSCFAAFGALKH